ncbi:MAG: divalent-cation tolerance protein CutA [Oligoflexia bacterium]|nr:divalent-cation tolerance protein CutA [Oligoflexia bacterium]
MVAKAEFSIVITTVANEQEAHKLARQLCESKLAACVQTHAITSVYRWKGAVESSPEFTLLIKSRRELFPQLCDFIKAHHAYEIPEIVQIPIEQGLNSYLRWIDESTRS